MSGGYPSMTALLGLLAIAGYQNRDKLAELLGGGGQNASGSGGSFAGSGGSSFGSGAGSGVPSTGGQGGLGGLLGQLGGAIGGGGAGSLISGGIGELVDRFKQNGQGEVAESWVGHGPNRDIAPDQLERAIGPDVLATLSQKTGLSREELLARLSRDLPQAIDRYTPEGRIPPAAGSGARF